MRIIVIIINNDNNNNDDDNNNTTTTTTTNNNNYDNTNHNPWLSFLMSLIIVTPNLPTNIVPTNIA